MDKTATRLTEPKIGGKQFYCVTWPKPGKGRNRQFFRQKSDAETFLKQKLAEQRNYGIAGSDFNLRQRAEYLECAGRLAPFKATLRQAVNFYLPHLEATSRSRSANHLVQEVLAAKKADGGSRRYIK